jgi:hypothetical protein
MICDCLGPEAVVGVMVVVLILGGVGLLLLRR